MTMSRKMISLAVQKIREQKNNRPAM